VVELLGRWSRVMTESSDLQVQVYFDRTHRRIPGSYTENLNTYNMICSIDFLWVAAGHRVGLGID